jgi:hypothetical protein
VIDLQIMHVMLIREMLCTEDGEEAGARRE